MEVLTTVLETQNLMKLLRSQGKSIGFVPTMGALHHGHISLVQQAVNENDVVVSSIFVNPIQFNNPEDLEKYPRTFESDVEMLNQAGCNYIFYPTVSEMYPDKVTKSYEFGALEMVMEGAFRPGHFNGVAVVVHKLFDIVQPHKAYFGKKDYQQLAVIRMLVEMEKIPITIVAAETVREPSGLAMSSRNMRLSETDREKAAQISKTLSWVKSQKGLLSIKELEEMALSRLKPDFNPEYFQIVNAFTLQPVNSWTDAPKLVACVAAHIGGVRLIDNLEL